MGHDERFPLWKSCLFNPIIHPSLLILWPLSFLVLRHLMFSIAVVIITKATRGRRLTRNLNMCPNKQLQHLTYMVVFMSMDWTGHLKHFWNRSCDQCSTLCHKMKKRTDCIMTEQTQFFDADCKMVFKGLYKM